MLQTNLLNTWTSEKWLLKRKNSLNCIFVGLLSLSTSLFDALKIDIHSKPVSSRKIPLEVLIRTPVIRVIVVSRGMLPHSWAAHSIVGSEFKKEFCVWSCCSGSPLDFTLKHQKLKLCVTIKHIQIKPTGSWYRCVLCLSDKVMSVLHEGRLSFRILVDDSGSCWFHTTNNLPEHYYHPRKTNTANVPSV